MFISELTLAAWMNVPSSKKVIQIKDLSVAITTFHSYDFLIGVAPPPNACIKQPVRHPYFLINSLQALSFQN